MDLSELLRHMKEMHPVQLALEVGAYAILLAAICTGLITLWRHSNKFDEFRVKDLLPTWLRSRCQDGLERSRKKQLRIQGFIYALLTSSTSFTLYDLMSRSVWLYEQGWQDASLKWKAVFLFVHIGIGITFTAMHVLFDMLLSDDEFCALCRRRIEHVRTTQQPD